MIPVQKTVIGTGTSVPFIPDLFQNPFNIGIGVVVTGGTATYSVEHCFEFATVMSPTWNGTSNVTWMPNTGITNATTATTNGNYAFGVAAIRLNVTGAQTATTTVVANFLQSVNSP
jgi:hypothetical protein